MTLKDKSINRPLLVSLIPTECPILPALFQTNLSLVNDNLCLLQHPILQFLPHRQSNCEIIFFQFFSKE